MDMSQETRAPVPRHLVLYDGLCGLCDRTVQWLLARDKHRALYFAPLQGETAAALRARHPEIPAGLSSVVYLEDERVHVRSKALLHLARHLGRPWRWAYGLRWLPGWPLDLAYRLIARVRYRVWGTRDACRLPSPDQARRFLP